jgi:hypothetical protein
LQMVDVDALGLGDLMVTSPAVETRWKLRRITQRGRLEPKGENVLAALAFLSPF